MSLDRRPDELGAETERLRARLEDSLVQAVGTGWGEPATVVIGRHTGIVDRGYVEKPKKDRLKKGL